VLAYVLTISGLLLTMGRLADFMGLRRVYVAGLTLFMVASALCAAAPSASLLVAARALQGLGAAMMSANSAALLIAAFGAGERGRALGAFGAMVGVGLALGPPLGGILVGISRGAGSSSSTCRSGSSPSGNSGRGCRAIRRDTGQA
jgi:MFS family permease